MAELSGNPNVTRQDSVAASYLKTQDYQFNPLSGSAISVNVTTLNYTGTFTSSGSTATAGNSGPFAPLGYFPIRASGATVVVPFFAP
jgi:hypothetical protein